ncbi:MAG: hypothetical protein GY869_01565, partial [Planctomycetes bacterium]|nr:hypothetical protein [Planctomycetota bacterium]
NFFEDKSSSFNGKLTYQLNKNTFFTLGANYFSTERFRGDGKWRKDMLAYARPSGVPGFDNTTLFWSWDDMDGPTPFEYTNYRWDGSNWGPFEESYTDQNGNGRWDRAEPFRDDNGNGVADGGEHYYDVNGNGVWDDQEPYEDTTGNGHYDDGEIFQDIFGNHQYDEGEDFVDLNENGEWDADEPFTDLPDEAYSIGEPFTDAADGEWGQFGDEPFVDFGLDNIRSINEWSTDADGYLAPFDATDNPDPAGDDYHYFDNPTGPEGNNLYDEGEQFTDWNGNGQWD